MHFHICADEVNAALGVLALAPILWSRAKLWIQTRRWKAVANGKSDG